MSALDIQRQIRDIQDRLERLEKSDVSLAQSGTWTPAFTGSGTPGTFGYAGRNGYYLRDGSRIDIFGYIVLNAITVAPTGVMAITGLPVTATALANYRAGVTFGVIDNFNYTGATTAIELTGVIVASGTSILLFESFDSAATVQVPAANFTNANCNLQFSATYLI